MSLTPTGEQIRSVDAPGRVDATQLLGQVSALTREKQTLALPARDLAERLFGDHMKANLITLGAASQAGLLPVTPATIEAAIELNKVDVLANQLAFRYGRHWVSDRESVERHLAQPPDEPLKRLRPRQRTWLKGEVGQLALPAEVDEVTRRRVADLIDYADQRYATDYLEAIREIADEERRRRGEAGESTRSVAHYLHKLMAYKDEYEVARLLPAATVERGHL